MAEGKLLLYSCSSSNGVTHRYHGTPQLLASGLLSCWRGTLSSTAGVSRVDLKYSG